MPGAGRQIPDLGVRMPGSGSGCLWDLRSGCQMPEDGFRISGRAGIRDLRSGIWLKRLPDYKPVSVPWRGGSHSSGPDIAGRL